MSRPLRTEGVADASRAAATAATVTVTRVRATGDVSGSRVSLAELVRDAQSRATAELAALARRGDDAASAPTSAETALADAAFPIRLGLLRIRDATSVNPRVPRKLVSTASIVVRDLAVVFELGEVRAVLLRDELVVVEPDWNVDGERASALSGAAAKLAMYLRARSAPPAPETRPTPTPLVPRDEIEGGTAKSAREEDFAALAIETTLWSVVRGFAGEADELERASRGLQAELADKKRTVKLLDDLRRFRNVVDQFEAGVSAAHDALSGVLGNGLQLAAMSFPSPYTAVLDASADRTAQPMEMLVEAFTLDVASVLSRVRMVREGLISADEELSISLDAKRNTLLKVLVVIKVTVTGASCGALIAESFGMNLVSGLEQMTNGVFFYMAGFILILVVGIIVTVPLYLHRNGYFV